ncbi:RING-H2 finger protein ATL60-like [Vigna unguiculata]|uniref:RING-H2 finger protein ATL60-like n=1 Tax=Vigna unguiculata TaxID=3917 RepID=UPI0010168E42|nr:RING-H2 finger protein ATL60-like [Vigna unguiculata]
MGEQTDTLGESPAVELIGKVMIIVIIIFFFLVVIALGVHLFTRNFWWREPAPQSRRRRRFVFSSGQEGGLRRGLDPSVLSSIPVLVFQAQDFKEGLECSVCLSEVVEGEKARLLPKCNHGFHVGCIDMWFQSHSTCPLCRNSVSAQSDENNSAQNSEAESPTFPTNVLVWGDHNQITSTGAASLEESASQPPCPSSSSSAATCDDDDSNNSNRRHGTLVIDIPSDITSSSLSPSANRFAEDDLKSPMTGRLRSLKRLLSRDRRLNPWSPTSVDVEQQAANSGGGGHS